jgi:hypothetical protein
MNVDGARAMAVPADLIHPVVMRRLNPSSHRLCKIRAEKMDPRAKPAGIPTLRFEAFQCPSRLWIAAATRPAHSPQISATIFAQHAIRTASILP